jgi:hypothetical protein
MVTIHNPSWHNEYLMMPFGLTNAPSVFQALANDVLRDMPINSLFDYWDGILIFSPNEISHNQHVQQVLRRLLHHKLFVKT